MSNVEGRISRGIVREAVSFFGEPPLLVDASEVIWERFVTATDVEPPVATYGEIHSTYDFDNYFTHVADLYQTLMTEKSPNEPDVHVGYLHNEPSEVRCIWHQENTWPETDRKILQETTVVFFGGNNERIRQHYAMFDFAGSRLSYPPAGVFVDFSCFEEGEQVASLYGTVGSSGNRNRWAMEGRTLDKSILPAGEHILNNFSMSFPRTLLLPAKRTITPQFFLEDIPSGVR